jgi:hypothetical protein
MSITVWGQSSGLAKALGIPSSSLGLGNLALSRKKGIETNQVGDVLGSGHRYSVSPKKVQDYDQTTIRPSLKISKGEANGPLSATLFHFFTQTLAGFKFNHF